MVASGNSFNTCAREVVAPNNSFSATVSVDVFGDSGCHSPIPPQIVPAAVNITSTKGTPSEGFKGPFAEQAASGNSFDRDVPLDFGPNVRHHLHAPLQEMDLWSWLNGAHD